MLSECWCCGKPRLPVEVAYVHKTWEGRMSGYCQECAWARCDAFPGECPNRGGVTT